MVVRFLKVLVIFTLLFSITACNNNDEEAKNKDKKEEPKTAQVKNADAKQKTNLSPEPRYGPYSSIVLDHGTNNGEFLFTHDQGNQNFTINRNQNGSKANQNNQGAKIQNKDGQFGAAKAARGRKPRNVILLIGDGMGIGHMEVARLFEHGKEGRLFMQGLPHVALSQTYSADNTVPDSAAAGTSLAAGAKTNNSMIGITPDGTDLNTILDSSLTTGKRVGIVSTNTVTDATPAAFYASVKTRAGQDEIARQLLQKDIDVILGGGRSNFTPEKQNGVDLIQGFKDKGYTYVTSRNELVASQGNKLIGLFHDSFMNYKIDRNELNSTETTLTEMTAKTIDILSKNAANKGFFAMIEGARIDHAAHAADFASIWKETVEFDDAVKYAVDWAKKDKNTLVVVLADHETMGIAATETMQIPELKNIQVSPEFMAKQLSWDTDQNAYTTESVKEVFQKHANINLSDDEVAQFNQRILNTQGKRVPTHVVGWEIGTIIAETYHAGALNSEIRSLSRTGGHTANMVPIFSYGIGAENFDGVLDNTDIPKMLAQLIGTNL